jgi:hypothetical protein
MRYLHPGDYSIQVRNEIASLLSENKESITIKAEDARVAYLRGEWKIKYDVDQIFRTMSLWDASRVYTAPVAPALPELVYYKKNTESVEDYKIYAVAVTTTAGQSPETTPASWAEYTGRNPFVVLKLVDLILYDLHSKYARRAMPQLVEDRYLEAVKWVERVRDGLVNPDLPLKPEVTGTNSGDIRYNSHEVEEQRW